MKTLKIIITLIVAITLSSCEDVIQVKLDKGKPLVTIDAFINDMRTQQKVRLTYTDDYFSQKPNEGIKGASVVLKDLTTGAVFNFTDNSTGDYVFDIGVNDTIARLDHQYELIVTHQGTTYTAQSKLKRTTTIDSIDVKFEEGGFGGEEGYYFSFFGKDPEGPEPDFYWIKSYRNGVFFNKGSEINIAWDGANGDGADGLYFIPPIAMGITPFGEVFKKNDVCRVEILSINKETYYFLTQIQNQTTNSGLFATTPENVKCNIQSSNASIKVVGWFCMSAVSAKEKIAL